MTPEDVVKTVESVAPSISFDQEFEKFDIPPQVRQDMRTSYYRHLAGYCKVFRPAKVLEMGTFRGASAVAMAKYAGHVLTLDMFTHHLLPAVRSCPNITSIQVSQDGCLDYDYSQFDLIFVDIDHDGTMEMKVYEKMRDTYQGVAFWDDVNLNPAMQEFWYSVPNKVTTLWHDSGFGVSVLP